MATMSYRLYSTRVPRGRLAVIQTHQSALGPGRFARSKATRSDRPRAGLSLRSAPKANSRASAGRDDHHVLAYSVAELRNIWNLSVERGDSARPARQHNSRIPHSL